MQRWLGSKTKAGTRGVYRSAFRKFQKFSGMTAKQLKDEIDEEGKKKLTEQGNIENRIRQFYRWATEQSGLSPNLARTYVGAVRGFYRFYNYRCNFRRDEFKATRIKPRKNLTKDDIRKMVNAVKTLRDRAIILTLYQAGMDISTLSSLKYHHVRKGIEKGEVPLKLDIIREKEGVEDYTYLAEDAIAAIRAYINERLRKEGAIEPHRVHYS